MPSDKIKSWPAKERPREKLLAEGAAKQTDTDLIRAATEKEAMAAGLGVGSAEQLSYWEGYTRGMSHREGGGAHGDRTWKDYDHQANEKPDPIKAALGRGFIDGFSGNFPCSFRVNGLRLTYTTLTPVSRSQGESQERSAPRRTDLPNQPACARH